MTGRDPRSPLPLPAHDFHILLSVLEERRHGYGIIQDIAIRTDGETRLGTSTLYAALKRLERGGLIRAAERPAADASSDERRQYFIATPFGRAVAREEARRIERLHRLATAARLETTSVKADGRPS